MAAFAQAVSHVVSGRANEQMRGIDATTVVAPMANQESIWYRPEMQFVGNPMREKVGLSSGHLPVSDRTDGRHPDPTTTDRNALKRAPEPIDDAGRESGACRSSHSRKHRFKIPDREALAVGLGKTLAGRTPGFRGKKMGAMDCPRTARGETRGPTSNRVGQEIFSDPRLSEITASWPVLTTLVTRIWPSLRAGELPPARAVTFYAACCVSLFCDRAFNLPRVTFSICS